MKSPCFLRCKYAFVTGAIGAALLPILLLLLLLLLLLHVHFSFAFLNYTAPFSVLRQINSQGHLEIFSQSILERCFLFLLLSFHSLNTHRDREIKTEREREKKRVRKRMSARFIHTRRITITNATSQAKPSQAKWRDRTDVCRCCRRCRRRRYCISVFNSVLLCI